MLEWVADSFFSRSSQPGIELGLLHCRRILCQVSYQGWKSICYWGRTEYNYEWMQKQWSSWVKQKQYLAVEVSGNERKVWCCEEQYCIGTWNIKSMNQGKLHVVKQEMASVIIDILGISELKWMEMGEFNSDDCYIYYYGKESLRRNGVDLIVNKRVWNAVLGCNLKNNRMISVRFQGRPFNVIVIHVCAPATEAEKAEVDWFCEDLQHLLELTPKRCPFHH